MSHAREEHDRGPLEESFQVCERYNANPQAAGARHNLFPVWGVSLFWSTKFTTKRHADRQEPATVAPACACAMWERQRAGGRAVARRGGIRHGGGGRRGGQRTPHTDGDGQRTGAHRASNGTGTVRRVTHRTHGSSHRQGQPA